MKRALLLIVLIAGAGIRAEQWPQFRGPGSTGVGEGEALPDSWSATENVAWKVTIPGQGWSSPIAWGDRIFVTSVVPAGEIETPKKGLYLQGERPAPSIEHRYLIHAISFATGQKVATVAVGDHPQRVRIGHIPTGWTQP